MLLHNVYFWLQDNLDTPALTTFEQGLTALTNDPAVAFGYYGKPANTHRDVIERSYAYGLVLIFDDLAAHDTYQVGAVHLKFVDENRSKWQRVIVHDIQTD